jgi:hypothetical protein
MLPSAAVGLTGSSGQSAVPTEPPVFLGMDLVPWPRGGISSAPDQQPCPQSGA